MLRTEAATRRDQARTVPPQEHSPDAPRGPGSGPGSEGRRHRLLSRHRPRAQAWSRPLLSPAKACSHRASRGANTGHSDTRQELNQAFGHEPKASLSTGSITPGAAMHGGALYMRYEVEATRQHENALSGHFSPGYTLNTHSECLLNVTFTSCWSACCSPRNLVLLVS